MLNKNKILIVIPVYNHAPTLRAVIQGCLKYHDQILIVDDGSTDNITAALADLDINIVKHDHNKGKGAAIMTAAKWARDNDKSHIITIDADGQHYPENIPDFFNAIETNPEAIVIGVRDFTQPNVPGSSRFGRAFGNFWVRLQTGHKVCDIQSGFRAYPVYVLNNLHYMFKSYAFEDEVIVRALWSAVPVDELPINVFYPPADIRVSHFNKLTENIKLTLLNTYLTIRAVLPWPHKQIIYSYNQYNTISHPLKIIKDSLAQKNTVNKIALAGALGVFLGALPLLACHTLIIIYIASLFRLNKSVAVAASQICMPPIVPALCIEAGYFMRFGHFLTIKGSSVITQSTIKEIGYMGVQRLGDWFLGSLVVGPTLALITAIFLYITTTTLRKKITKNST